MEDFFSRFPEPNCKKTYVFSRFDVKESLTAATVLRSLIRQCLDADKMSPRIEEALKSLLGQDVTMKELGNFLRLVISHSDKHIIVVDGMDDSTPKERRLLYGTLLGVAQESTTAVKLLVVGRDTVPATIKDIGPAILDLRIPYENVRKDISHFVECEVADLFDNHELRVGDSSLILEIARSLVDNAQDM